VSPADCEVWSLFELRFGDEAKTGGPGTIAMLPRGIPHSFRNDGTTPGKVYTVITPARFEGFFAIGKKYDLEFLPSRRRSPNAKVKGSVSSVGHLASVAIRPRTRRCREVTRAVALSSAAR
jgi:hypothetical protein